MRASVAQRRNEDKYTWNTLIASWFFRIAVYFYLREVYACIKFYAQHGKTSLESYGPSTNLYGEWAVPRIRHQGFKVYWKTEDDRKYLVVSWDKKEEADGSNEPPNTPI